MSSLKGFRDTDPATPFRYLYGVRDGELLFPLDLAFTQFDPDTPDRGRAFIDAQVNGAGFRFGTIRRYSWPAAGSVTPLVHVAPDADFPLESAIALPPLPLTSVATGRRVTVDLDGSVIGGTVVTFDDSAPYIDLTLHTVAAYIVRFDPPLLPDSHGAPVFTEDDGTLVGMITASQRVGGAPNTLVCPL
jgi:hypothetical protein